MLHHEAENQGSHKQNSVCQIPDLHFPLLHCLSQRPTQSVLPWGPGPGTHRAQCGRLGKAADRGVPEKNPWQHIWAWHELPTLLLWAHRTVTQGGFPFSLLSELLEE